MTATTTIMIISGFRASTTSSSRCRLSLSPYYSLGAFQRRLHASYPSHSPLHRSREMVEMTRRRIHGNGDSAADKAKSPTGAVRAGEREHHDHELPHTRPHTDSHSHGIFGGHSHSHGHGHDGHDHGGGLIETLQSGGAHPVPFPPNTLLCVFTMAHTSTFFFFRIASPS
jgi:hypothetical protein